MFVTRLRDREKCMIEVVSKMFRASLVCGALLLAGVAQAGQPLIEGVFWQPDNQTYNPAGIWDQIGADTLAVQWMVVDGYAWYNPAPFPSWANQPDWGRITSAPWARKRIAGFPGAYSEPYARSHLNELYTMAWQMTNSRLPYTPDAYYFPVEADPSWADTAAYGNVLQRLPRPLWVSAYAAERQPANLVSWVNGWLPRDVGLFFQDGVGVGARTPTEARALADKLLASLSKQRFAIVLEAFRQQPDGSFRAAQAQEIIEQLKAYKGLRIYVFDGPHYLSDDTVRQIKAWDDANQKGPLRLGLLDLNGPLPVPPALGVGG